MAWLRRATATRVVAAVPGEVAVLAAAVLGVVALGVVALAEAVATERMVVAVQVAGMVMVAGVALVAAEMAEATIVAGVAVAVAEMAAGMVIVGGAALGEAAHRLTGAVPSDARVVDRVDATSDGQIVPARVTTRGAVLGEATGQTVVAREMSPGATRLTHPRGRQIRRSTRMSPVKSWTRKSAMS